MTPHVRRAGILVTALLAGCGRSGAADAAPFGTAGNSPAPPAVAVDSGAFDPAAFVLDTVASGLVVPWAREIAPDGRIFQTERVGRNRTVVEGKMQISPWARQEVFAQEPQLLPETGLLGIAVAPDFSATGHVYVVGTFWKSDFSQSNGVFSRVYRKVVERLSPQAAGRWENRVYRITDRDGVGADPQLIIDNLPASHYHSGSSITFGPDGMLYVTTGDVLRSPLAQSRESLAGKVLRFNPDGTIPDDNPVPGSPILASGLRNTQALAWHPSGLTLFGADHGPTGMPHEEGRWGNDELNVIQAGGNYGWPIVVGDSADTRYARPVTTWTPALAPGGMAFYDSDTLPWRGNLFVSGLRSMQLRRVVIAPDSSRTTGWRVVREDILFEREFGRIRAVRAAPDGSIYFATSNLDGRGIPAPGDDHLFRIRPR
jgi:glucose/arabinose dehydrogenase